MENIDYEIVGADIREMLWTVWKNKLLIFLICAIVAVAAYISCYLLKTPMFTATTEIYILDDKNGEISYNDMQLASQLTNDYTQMIKNNGVMERAVENLQIEGLTAAMIAGKIGTYSKADTRIIVITATDADPYRAYIYANAVRDAAKEVVRDIVNFDSIRLVSKANVPVHASGNGAGKTAILMFGVAFIACVAVIVIKQMLNDTLKTPMDVESYLSISVLGSVPLDKSVITDVRYHHSRKRRRRN